MMKQGTNRIDYADVIKARVSVPDAVEQYTGQRIVRNRICCPVHHGDDRNMRIYRDTYHCFVCHATGDVIQFVRAVTGDTFQDSMKRLNNDFALGLPIGDTNRSDLDWKALDTIKRELAERNIQNRLDAFDETLNGMRQANLVGLIRLVESICESERPRDGDADWLSSWCEAMKLRTVLYDEIR